MLDPGVLKLSVQIDREEIPHSLGISELLGTEFNDLQLQNLTTSASSSLSGILIKA